MWHEGILKIKENDHVYLAIFKAKVFQLPSRYGICEGRISKLNLIICGETVCNYDDGWDITPTCSLAEKALKELLYMCDGRSTDAAIPYVSPLVR